MTSTTTKAEAVHPEAGSTSYLFDDWFDPIEAGLRERVRGFIETMLETELDAVLARPRYGRRCEADDGGAAGVAGHRHGRRTRLLTSDQNEIVAQTHYPTLGAISDADLSDLVKRLRDRRDRAQDIARQQRREMRGKAPPAGASAATDNSGTKEKGALLSAALKRANKESSRRRSTNAKTELTRNAKRALEMAQESGDANENRPQSRTADEGMQSVPNRGIAPSGAVDQEGGRPVLERSRKVR